VPSPWLDVFLADTRPSQTATPNTDSLPWKDRLCQWYSLVLLSVHYQSWRNILAFHFPNGTPLSSSQISFSEASSNQPRSHAGQLCLQCRHVACHGHHVPVSDSGATNCAFDYPAAVWATLTVTVERLVSRGEIHLGSNPRRWFAMDQRSYA